MPATSRRALLTGLVVMPAVSAGATVVSVTSTDAPLFAAIERHRCARAMLDTIDQLAEPARYAAAEHELGVSGEAMFAIRPQTPAGAKALVDFILEDAGVVEGDWCHRALGVLSEALPQLETR